jgi:PKD repeat protein
MLRRHTAVIGIVLLSVLFPFYSYAAVRINEIAWMGTTLSGTDEWIELSNDGTAAVDLSGWKIDAEDGSPSIDLSGQISSGGFFLIERTDDTTVPDVTADLVAAFGNGLGNAGETLRLRDASGAIVDTVVGGADWALIGGDNTTKDTPQRRSASSGWVTGKPTPRTATVVGGEVLGTQTTSSAPETSSPSASTTDTTGSSVKKAAYASSVYPRETLTVSAGRDIRTFTGLSVSFSGNALGLYDEPLPYATYRWNFGDGATAVGKMVDHVYRFPGEYTVTLQVSNATLESSDRALVVVVPPSVVFGQVHVGPDGYVELKNESDQEVDISGWILSSSLSGQSFVFPPHSIMPPRHATPFPNQVTALLGDGGVFTLRFANGTTVAEYGITPVQQPLPPEAPRTVGLVSGASIAVSTRESADHTPPSPPVKEVIGETMATGSAAATVLWSREGKSPMSGFGQGLSSGMRWFFVFFGMVLIGLAGVLLFRSRIDEPSPADEYAIISDIIEEGDEEINLVRK